MQETRIPKVFHFVFGLRPQTSPFHLAHYLCLASCLEVNTPDAIVFHYENEPWGEYWDRIKPHLSLRPIERSIYPRERNYEDQMIARYSYAHLADFVRVNVLLQEGGVYADIDTLFLRPLPDALFTYPFVMGKERLDRTRPEAAFGGSLCNALMMSARDAEFGRLWLRSMYSEFDGSWSRHSTFLPYRLSQEYPDLIHVEPESSFFKLDWSQSGIADLFERERTDLDNAYSVHLWEHLWWERSRVDFSRFHSGRLTPAYVTHAETTFARSARRFLPDELRPAPSVFHLEAMRDWPGTTARYVSSRLGRRLKRLVVPSSC